MASIISDLEQEYCPPLDVSLVYAIANEQDLNDVEALREVRQNLDLLKASATAEDTVGFDPSGSSKPDDRNPRRANSTSSPSDDADLFSNRSTDVTDVTSSLDAFLLEDSVSYDKGIDAMTDAEKEALLKEMFRTLKPFDIQYTFKKKQSDFGAAVEELLNQQFLQEEALRNGSGPSTPRGIDGFASLGHFPAKPKGKAKGKRKKGAQNAVDLDEHLVEGSTSRANRWQKADDDVNFITSRTCLGERLVRSIYNTSNHSIRATLVAICRKPASDLPPTTDPDDALVQSNIVDLATLYPTIPTSQLTRLILLTHPIFSAAKDLAAVLAYGQAKETIVPQYAAAQLPAAGAGAELDEEEGVSGGGSGFLACGTALPIGRSYESVRALAFAQASAAFRKSRSSAAMGGAAAYYASVGHAANTALKRERALEANAKVAAQSSVNGGGAGASGDVLCDLHGVTVPDATRIARQYVARWWDARQEWAREGKVMAAGRQAPQFYRVVVGRGAHSVDNKGKLGPAVAKALKADGWRVDEQVGEIIVRGKARR